MNLKQLSACRGKTVSNSELNDLLAELIDITNIQWRLIEFTDGILRRRHSYSLLFAAEFDGKIAKDWYHVVDFYCEGCKSRNTTIVDSDTIAAYIHGILTGIKLNKPR